MKPKAQTEHEEGLLEYLEDIIGTSKYKTAIEEALVQVDALNEVMGEKKGRLGIVVRELNALKVRLHAFRMSFWALRLTTRNRPSVGPLFRAARRRPKTICATRTSSRAVSRRCTSTTSSSSTPTSPSSRRTSCVTCPRFRGHIAKRAR
jgi:biotin synthase-related radical SAM superfamily protein